MGRERLAAVLSLQSNSAGRAARIWSCLIFDKTTRPTFITWLCFHRARALSQEHARIALPSAAR